ncbi:MAG: phosphatidylglycerophosphatase A [bacterium]
MCFRFFDITKFPPVNWCESFRESGGIVWDDVMAGVYAQGMLIVISYFTGL